jgi:hypothetical protein
LVTYIFKKLNQVLGLCFCVCVTANAMSGGPSDSEKWQYLQKTKIIKHLVEIVVWPNSAIPDKNLHICMLGRFPDEESLNKLNGTIVNGFKLDVTKISDALKNGQNCHLIYIGNSETKNTLKIIKAFEKKPVLLLGDMSEFAEKGGNMNFVMLSANQVGLTINLERMEQSNLKIDMKEFQQFTIFPEEQDINKLLN